MEVETEADVYEPFEEYVKQVCLNYEPAEEEWAVWSGGKLWGFVQKKTFWQGSLSNEETKEVKKELDEIDKKFDEARGVKFKVN